MVKVGETEQASNAVLARKSEALRDALRRYFGRQGCAPHEIDDLVQEVFLRIIQRGDADRVEQLDGYIFQTAASVLTDRHRRRRVRAADRHEPFEIEHHPRDDVSPDEVLLGREALGQVGAALLALPERTRQVFVLRRFEEMSFREIALRLGLSLSAVEKHMLRAVRSLKARLGDDR